MAATNVRAASDVYSTERTAAGLGTLAAKQSAEKDLRRCVLACLLWEKLAFAKGSTVADDIAELIPQVDPDRVAALAIECRHEQKLRHVPLFMASEMCRHESHRPFVEPTLWGIIRRPDEMGEFLALYWKGSDRKKGGAIPAAAKRGLAKAFNKFDEYQLAKWNRTEKAITLRDVMFLVHPKPYDIAQQITWQQLVANKLPTPVTWEVGLSAAKDDNQRRAVWRDLIESRTLGAFALLKNLRTMQEDKVPRNLISMAITNANPAMLLPLDFVKAVQYAPDFQGPLEMLMFQCLDKQPKLPGWTVFVVDVSGSMGAPISDRSAFDRLAAAKAMTMLAMECCEHAVVYCTAGGRGGHATERIPAGRGFALNGLIDTSEARLGGGGIFTRQCIDWLRTQESEDPDRIIVFTDSQDREYAGSRAAKPFGKRNYLIDVSAHKLGVNYRGAWTAEISGWSESFLKYIAALEHVDG